jgi:hypothetical protein
MNAAAAPRLRDAYGGLPRRSRYVLTVRLVLGGHALLTQKQAGEPLGRIRQLQVLAINELAALSPSRRGDEPRRSMRG